MSFSLRKAAVLLLASAAICLALRASSAEDTSRRKIIVRSEPAYPVLARSMGLSGVVKIDAVVAPDGTVRSVQVKGGHPVLTQSATNAVLHWRWEPAAHETHELLEIKFSPPE